MFDTILLLIIFLSLIIIILQQSENMSDHNFSYLNSKSSLFLSNNLYPSNEQIELTSLPSCDLNIKFDYGTNYNLIVNDGISIHQDIIDPLQHTIEIDNINYNLTSIRWKISKFRYNDKSVGLDLHFIHQNFDSLHKLVIIIPLSLVNNFETFKNIGYNKMSKNFDVFTDTLYEYNSDQNFKIPNYFQLEKKKKIILNSQKNNYNLNIDKNKTKFSLNKLITSTVLVPNYECCVHKIGQNLRVNLCDVQQILQKQKKYYQLEDKEANKYYITEPQEFDEDIGLEIINKISFDFSVFYIKK